MKFRHKCFLLGVTVIAVLGAVAGVQGVFDGQAPISLKIQNFVAGTTVKYEILADGQVIDGGMKLLRSEADVLDLPLPADNPLFTLAVLLAFGALCGQLAKRIGLPSVTGQILAGICVAVPLGRRWRYDPRYSPSRRWCAILFHPTQYGCELVIGCHAGIGASRVEQNTRAIFSRCNHRTRQCVGV